MRAGIEAAESTLGSHIQAVPLSRASDSPAPRGHNRTPSDDPNLIRCTVSSERRKRPARQVRIKVTLLLTPDETARLEARAAGEIRPIGNYVAWVIEQHLATKPKKRRPRDADPSEERVAYDVGPFLTVPERRELEKRAAAERRWGM